MSSMATTDAKSEGVRPSVSIGVPVYNGEEYLEEALASIAAQTRTDYEVIISDNASTDRSAAICQSFAARFPQVRYYRNPVNIGGDKNYYRCFELSRGDFFLGLAHDDRLHAEYLQKTLAVLEADTSVVFCHSMSHKIDARGEIVGTDEAKPFSDSPSPSVRFRDSLGFRPIIACLGVLRSSTLRTLPPLMAYPGSDACWQVELALRGKLVQIPDVLFYRRVHEASGQAIPLHERIRWSDPAKTGAIIFPGWRRPWEYARSAFRVPMSFSERVGCLAGIADYLKRRGGFRPFFVDVKVALKTLLRRSGPGSWLLSRWSRAHRH
jgi:glycosyltransferase involved in cell wall biosynthesis